MPDYLASLSASCSIAKKEVFNETHAIRSGYRANLVLNENYFPCEVKVNNGEIKPGESGEINIECIITGDISSIKKGLEFELREGPNTIAKCHIKEVKGLERRD